MKKFYAFFAAALISVCAFASKDVVPSDAVLADYYNQGDVCLAFFVPADMNCNNIVVTGSFNGWKSTPAECATVEAVEGYDGWYVASFEAEAEPDAQKGMQAKPIMLDADGNFNWEYQVGAATVIRGGVQVVAGYSGEIDLINYGADAPNVFTVDAWKQNPCTAVYHNYTITVISDGCGGYVVPFIAGAMTSWTDNGWTQMQLDEAKTLEYQVPTYNYSFKAAENTPYQIVSGKMDAQGAVPTEGEDAPGWNDNAYLQVYIDGSWTRYNPDNSFTGAEANIVYDLRVDTLQWARCDETPSERVIFGAKFPTEGAPAEIEIIGTFDNWQGTMLEFITETGWYFADIMAKGNQFFKFRSAGSWDNELQLYNAEDDSWHNIGDGELTFGNLWSDDTWKGEPVKFIELDFSDANIARWSASTGVEDIVLTVQAKKVVVDGVLYIVRDNKLFNVQGAQVR